MRLIAMRIVSFEPTAWFIVPVDNRVDPRVKAAYDEAVLMTHNPPPPLVWSSDSEALSPGPRSSSSSEPEPDVDETSYVMISSGHRVTLINISDEGRFT